MRLVRHLFISIPLLVAVFCVSQGNAQTRGESTVHGEIVDVVSFVSSFAKQDTAAIRRSAMAGNPLGIYDKKAKRLYIIGRTELNASPGELVLPYLGMRVFVIGRVYYKFGVRVILATDIGKSIK